MNRYYTTVLSFVITTLFISVVSAQTDTQMNDNSNKTEYIKLSGDFGVYGELYSISGREKRRPSSTERMFFNPTVSFYNALQLDFKFVFSSEGNSSRQDINQLDINPKWSWGEIHAGDFSLSYSPFTVSGIKIRGGSFDINPGKFRLASFGGISQREVITFNKQQSFKREIYGGLIGLGKSNKSHIQLTVLKAEDIFNTVENIIIDTSGFSDSLLADSTSIPEVTPKENVVTSLKTRLDIYKGKFVLNTEVSGSAYTRDLEATDLNPDEVPSGVNDIFTLKTSSSFDFAYKSDLKLKFKNMTITGKYKFIGPGYVSLGVASLQNDVKLIGTGFSFRQKKFMLRGNVDLQKDNLINQKIYTTNRNRYSFSINYRISRKWNMNNSLNLSTMKNDAVSDALLLDYTSMVLRTGNRLSLSKGIARSLSFDYTYQNSKDSNPLRTSSKLNSHSGSIGIQLTLSKNINISPMLKILLNKQGFSEQKTIQTYSLSGRHYAKQKKLSTSLRLSYSKQDDSDNLRGSIRSRYSVENFGSIGLEISFNKFTTDLLNRTSFDESFIKFTYNKSF